MLLVTVLPVVGTMSVCGREGVRGGVWDRVGIGEGVIPGTQRTCKAEADTAKRAPELPCRGTGVGGICCSAPGSQTTHSGPQGSSGARFAVWGLLLGNTRLWANKSEI